MIEAGIGEGSGEQASFLASLGRVLWRLLEAQRVDAGALFSRNGLDPSLVGQPRARYPVDPLCAAWVDAAAISGLQHIGLEAAKYYSPLDLNALGVTFLSSADLVEALQRLDRYETVLNSNLDFTLFEQRDRVDLTCQMTAPQGQAGPIMEDARLSVVLDLCRKGLGGALDPLEIAFTYPEPADTGEHFGLFRCPLVFGAAVSRISIRLDDTRRPFTDACRELATVNDQILDSMIKELASPDIVTRVKRAIIDQLPSGAPEQGDVAKQLFVSNRTLQRRLADEGTNFRKLLLEVRRELAEQYIRDEGMPLAEISYMLGFADTSSFSRAFKQWTGDPPNAVRNSPRR